MCFLQVCECLRWKRRLEKFRAYVQESSKMKFKRRKKIRPETIDYAYFNELNDASIIDLFPRINVVENTSSKDNGSSTSRDTLEFDTHSFRERSSRLRGNHDKESSSIRILDSTKKEWITRARQNDTSSMIDMLKYYPEIVTFVDPISGYTALHWAAKHGNSKLARVLCTSNLLQIDKRSKGGYTALHLAQNFGHAEIVDLLAKDNNADVTIRDNYGYKSHHYAKRKEYNRLLLRVLF